MGAGLTASIAVSTKKYRRQLGAVLGVFYGSYTGLDHFLSLANPPLPLHGCLCRHIQFFGIAF